VQNYPRVGSHNLQQQCPPTHQHKVASSGSTGERMLLLLLFGFSRSVSRRIVFPCVDTEGRCHALAEKAAGGR
jgi:hypothetical protein